MTINASKDSQKFMRRRPKHIHPQRDIKSASDLRRSNNISQCANRMVEILSPICILGIIVYVGCNLTHTQQDLILRAIRGIELIFGFNIIYHQIFFFRKIKEESHMIKWIVDILVLLDILAWATSVFIPANGAVSQSFLGEKQAYSFQLDCILW